MTAEQRERAFALAEELITIYTKSTVVHTTLGRVIQADNYEECEKRSREALVITQQFFDKLTELTDFFIE